MHCIYYSVVKIIYIGNEKGEFRRTEKPGTKELDAQH